MNLAGNQCERKDASPEDVVHPAATTKPHDRWLRYGTPFGRNCRYGDVPPMLGVEFIVVQGEHFQHEPEASVLKLRDSNPDRDGKL